MIWFTVLRVIVKTAFSPNAAMIITIMMIVMMKKDQILNVHWTRKRAVGHMTGRVRIVSTIEGDRM